MKKDDRMTVEFETEAQGCGRKTEKGVGERDKKCRGRVRVKISAHKKSEKLIAGSPEETFI